MDWAKENHPRVERKLASLKEELAEWQRRQVNIRRLRAQLQDAFPWHESLAGEAYWSKVSDKLWQEQEQVTKASYRAEHAILEVTNLPGDACGRTMTPKRINPAPFPAATKSTTQLDAHLEEELDEALEETFPASDPIAVHPERVMTPSAVRRKRRK
jgi:DNA repair exonuclease SbcCD ATPase subunit